MKLRRIFPVMLLLVLAFVVLPFQVDASDDIIASGLHDHGPVEWKITSDGTLTISGNRSMQSYNSPSSYLWSSYADTITKVVVEDGMTTIANNAFSGMPQLKEAYIGSTVTEIGVSAFSDCPELRYANIPASATKICNGAFSGCSKLSEVYFDPEIEHLIIDQFAFVMSGVTELYLPGGVKEIRDYAFKDCEQLTTLSLSEGLEVIQPDAFAGCYALTGHLYLPASLETLGPRNFDYGAAWTSVDINTSLGMYTFENNTSLKSAVIGGNAQRVPNRIFQNCTALTSVIIMPGIKEVGWYAFEGCTSLKSISLPETLEVIGLSAFRSSGLLDISIPDSVVDIGSSAFSDCADLVSAKIGSGAEYTGGFDNCVNLKQIDLGSIRFLSGLSNCGLTSVVIPETVEEVANGALADCKNLTEIHFLGDAPFFGTNGDCFKNVKATAYYNPERAGWTEDVMQDYQGEIMWAHEGHVHAFNPVITPPTCKEDGYTTYICSCGGSYIDDHVKTNGHFFENGKCINCGLIEGGLFKLYGANMTLGNNLAMNFYIDPADLTEGEDYYAVITKTYADQDDLEVIVEDDTWEIAYDMYRITLDKVAAKEMSDEIRVVIYNDEGMAVSEVWKDSVRAYTMRMLQKEEAKAEPNVNQLALYVEMLNYGAAAQRHFKYNTGDLANNQLTNTQREYGLDEVEMHDFREIGLGYVGTSLTLESNILMNFYFNTIPADHDDIYAQVTYLDHYRDLKTIIVEGKDFEQYNDTTWKVPVAGLVVADCREMITINLYDADGKTIANARDSISGYTARMDGEGPLYVAIMKFGVAAYNSFHW